MRSPFPGMDPYLDEPAFWPDFHQRFVTYWCDVLAECVPDRYEVRIDERIRLQESSLGETRNFRPDVAISRDAAATAQPVRPAGAVTLEPVKIPLAAAEEIRESHLRILHRPDRALVAVLELLSPANKTGPGRSEYQAKRLAVLGEYAHLVVLDLLLGGPRLSLLRSLPPGDYYAMVTRGSHQPVCEVYAWSMRDPLPVIPVPLRTPDPDVPLDLSRLFALTYERGRYARSLRYSARPSVPLSEADWEWVQATVAGGEARA